MKKLLGWALVLVLVGIFLTACKSTGGQAGSTFYSTFSIAETASKLDRYLLPGPMIVQGMEAGPRGSLIQRHEEIVLPIDDQDIPLFLQALKLSIREEIEHSGAAIQDSQLGSSDLAVDTFSFGYQQDGHTGSIFFWGIPGDENTLVLVALLTEHP